MKSDQSSQHNCKDDCREYEDRPKHSVHSNELKDFWFNQEMVRLDQWADDDEKTRKPEAKRGNSEDPNETMKKLRNRMVIHFSNFLV
jgi:hypothetical protein